MWLYEIVLLMGLVAVCRPANVLTIVPFPSYSHQRPLLAVAEELVRQGHNLTVITTDPPKTPIENYTVVDISSTYKHFNNFYNIIGFSFQRQWHPIQMIKFFPYVIYHICDFQLGLPNVQQFIRIANQTKFDLVIIEDLMFASYYGLVHKIGSPPVVGITTFPPWTFVNRYMGIPANPSYMPELFIGFSDEMTFLERLANTLFHYYTVYLSRLTIAPLQEQLLRKHFGQDPPSALEMENNKSLVILPTDLTLSYAQPLPPNFIQIGPLHIEEKRPLPQDIERWIEDAEDGVVYFSLGSNMRGTSLKEEKRTAFLEAFRRFPRLRFLWKFEAGAEVSGVPSNVLIRKWMPQQDIFKHPKVRLFITQGGLQSTEEAIHHGLPVLGVPLFSDQPFTTLKMVREGAGLRIKLDDVSPDTVAEAVGKLLDDKSYKENALRLSRINRDHQRPAMETAIWWLEYVIRHNGARHLRPTSLDLAWYQYYLLDVHAAILLVLALVALIIYIPIKACLSLFKRKETGQKKRKEKTK